MRTSIVKALITVIAITFLSACSPDSIAPPEPPSDAGVTTLTDITSVPTPISTSAVEQVDLLHTLSGHSRRVMSVALSADGAFVASSSEDKKIKLWDVKSGQEVHTFLMTSIDMMDIAFSPDGSLLASGEAIWDVESKQELYTLERGRQIPTQVAFSPDGSLLAVALFFQPIQLWDVESGQVVRIFDEEADNRTTTIEFSPDGALLAAGINDGTVRLWDVESGKLPTALNMQVKVTYTILRFHLTADIWLLVAGFHQCEYGTLQVEK